MTLYTWRGKKQSKPIWHEEKIELHFNLITFGGNIDNNGFWWMAASFKLKKKNLLWESCDALFFAEQQMVLC